MPATEECESDVAEAPTIVSLVLVGRPGVGKSTTAEALARCTGLPRIEVGSFVRRAAAARGLTPLQCAQRIFAAGDHTYFVRQAVKEARRLGKPCIVVGPRMPVELHFLQEELHPTLAIGLLLPDAARYERIRQRRPGRVDVDDHEERERVEGRWGIGETLQKCDVVVYTRGESDDVVTHCLHEWLRVDRERALQQ